MFSVTVYRDGSPWTVQIFDVWNGLDGIGSVLDSAQMVVSADGLEVMVCSSEYAPHIFAVSTVTGGIVWNHPVYADIDAANRLGVLVGSPMAGRYLWRNTTHLVAPITSQLDMNSLIFEPFAVNPSLYAVQSVNMTVWADFLGLITYPSHEYFGPLVDARYGILASTNWSGNVHTVVEGIYEQSGNLALNIDSIEDVIEDPTKAIWHCHCDFSFAQPPLQTPPWTGAAAALEVTRYPGLFADVSSWTIIGCEMQVTFKQTGEYEPLDIELRDHTGTVLDVISDPNFNESQRWVPLQPGMNAYVRYVREQGEG